jgi:hypothetical protein
MWLSFVQFWMEAVVYIARSSQKKNSVVKFHFVLTTVHRSYKLKNAVKLAVAQSHKITAQQTLIKVCKLCTEYGLIKHHVKGHIHDCVNMPSDGLI